MSLGDEESTPVTENPCPDCGAELVVIGVPSPPPELDNIWVSIFATKCVKANEWRWCSSTGHLSVWIRVPKTPTLS